MTKLKFIRKTAIALSTILVAVFFLCGCETKEDIKNRADTKANDVLITEIDSCEYLTFRTYEGSIVFTHKGNCKYCRAWAEKHCH